MLYSTILNTRKNFTDEKFMELIMKWQESLKDIYDGANYIDGISWGGKYSEDYACPEKGLSMAVRRVILKEENGDIQEDVIGVHYTKTDKQIYWTTDIIFSPKDRKLAVMLDRSYEKGILSKQDFSTPYFMTLLIQYDCLIKDKHIEVLDKPIVINADNLDLLGMVLEGKYKIDLPVIYVSKADDGETKKYPFDPDKLAYYLKGSAHVLAEGDFTEENVLEELPFESTGRYFSDMRNGNAAVFYPDYYFSAYERKANRGPRVFSNQTDDTITKWADENIIQYSTLQNIPEKYSWSWIEAGLTEEKARHQANDIDDLLNMAAESEEELKKINNDRLAEIKRLKEENEQLKKELNEAKASKDSLYNNLNDLKQKALGSGMPLLQYGGEKDLFDGEIREMVLAAIETQVGDEKTKEGPCRQYDILSDILAHNNYRHVMKQKEENIRNALSGYKNLDSSTESKLKKEGFTRDRDSGHHIMKYYGSEKYKKAFSSTSSSVSTGKNMTSEIIRRMLFQKY